jgi:hypothetical protein
MRHTVGISRAEVWSPPSYLWDLGCHGVLQSTVSPPLWRFGTLQKYSLRYCPVSLAPAQPLMLTVPTHHHLLGSRVLYSGVLKVSHMPCSLRWFVPHTSTLSCDTRLDRLGSGSASENGGDGDTRRRCSRNDASHYGGLPAGADHAGIVRREDSLLSHIFLRGVKGVFCLRAMARARQTSLLWARVSSIDPPAGSLQVANRCGSGGGDAGR